MIIGYTNGYFDLFHLGHLNLLKRASGLCDRLIVGVISDGECYKTKGRNPIITLEQRLEIVSHLQCVNVAVPVYLDDKSIEWQSYKFNKLFVGSDHQHTPIWEIHEKVFKKLQVDIIYLPYTHGVSSTEIKQRIIDEAAQKKTTIS